MSYPPAPCGYPTSYFEWHSGLVMNYIGHLNSLLLEGVFDPGSGALLKRYAGRPAEEIAGAAGIAREGPCRLLVFQPPDGELRDGPESRERLAPVLSLFAVDDFEAGLELCRRLLAVEGAGHTAAIHTRSEDRARRFGVAMPVSRILVNLPAA